MRTWVYFACWADTRGKRETCSGTANIIARPAEDASGRSSVSGGMSGVSTIGPRPPRRPSHPPPMAAGVQAQRSGVERARHSGLPNEDEGNDTQLHGEAEEMAGARQAIFEQRKKTSQASRNDDCAGGADDRPVPLDAGNAGSEDETDAKQESGQVSIVAVEVDRHRRSEEHTSELQSLMRISYAVFCLKKKQKKDTNYRDIASHITTQTAA